MDQVRMQKLQKYYHKLKAISHMQNSLKYDIYQQKIQYYLTGGMIPKSYPISLNQANYNANKQNNTMHKYYTELMKYNENVKFSKQSTDYTKNNKIGTYKKHGEDAKFDYFDKTKYDDYFAKTNTRRDTLINKLLIKNIVLDNYTPIEYTAPKVIYSNLSVISKPPSYADAINPKDISNFNLDDRITEIKTYGDNLEKIEYRIKYVVDTQTNRPQNPMGLTGITGRGQLGRWGPNNAADPLVTRTRDNITEIVLIKRKDTGEWAIPGGMVEKGSSVSTTLINEFLEEAQDYLSMTKEQQKKERLRITKMFNDITPTPIYVGPVDDPRNTDNAWMQTTAINFHDDGSRKDSFGSLVLKAGDDAGDAHWVKLEENMSLYASHADFINTLIKLFKTKGVPI